MLDSQIIGCLGDGVSVLVVAEDNPIQVEIKQIDPEIFQKILIEFEYPDQRGNKNLLPAA